MTFAIGEGDMRDSRVTHEIRGCHVDVWLPMGEGGNTRH